jgi:hypothetical protein
MHVLDGIAALFKFLMPYASFALWDVTYRMDYAVHDGVVNSLVTSFSQNVTENPPYNCPSGAKCLTIGSRLSLTELLEVSNPDLLALLHVTKAACGPLPPVALIQEFKQLRRLTISFYPSDGLDNLYEFRTLENLDLRSFNDFDHSMFCNLTDQCRITDHEWSVHPNIGQLKNLTKLRVEGGVTAKYDPRFISFVSDLPQELFTLPKLNYVQIQRMQAKTQSFSDMIEMIGVSKSLTVVRYAPISFPSNLAAELSPNLSLLMHTPLVELALGTEGIYAFKDRFHFFNYSNTSFPTLKNLDLYGTGFEPIPKNSLLNEKLENNVGRSYWRDNKGNCSTADSKTRCRWYGLEDNAYLTRATYLHGFCK